MLLSRSKHDRWVWDPRGCGSNVAYLLFTGPIPYIMKGSMNSTQHLINGINRADIDYAIVDVFVILSTRSETREHRRFMFTTGLVLYWNCRNNTNEQTNRHKICFCMANRDRQINLWDTVIQLLGLNTYITLIHLCPYEQCIYIC